MPVRPTGPLPRGCLWLALTLAACSGDDGSAEGTDPSAGSDTGAPMMLPPHFSEPASGRLEVLTTRNDAITLAIEGVTLGVTDLVIDGQNLGPLAEGSPVGRLAADSLELYLRGSMVSGQHVMVLRTSDANGQAESEQIELSVTSDLPREPTAAAPTVEGPWGEHVSIAGQGDDAVLVAYESSPPQLHLVPRDEAGWDLAAIVTVSVPGLAFDAEARLLPASVLRYDRDDQSPGRVRVAWRTGPADPRIDVIDAPWDRADPETMPRASLTTADALAGRPAEWASLGRPALLGDLLVVELWAPLDVESPRPGDRAVVWSRMPLHTTDLESPQRLSVRADLVDLDRLGPVLDRTGTIPSGPTALSVRADQIQPLVLEYDPVGGLRARPTAVDGRDRSFSFVGLPLATVVGALGGRTVAGLAATANGRLRVTLIDDLGDGGVTSFSFSRDDFPPLDLATGELWPAAVAGQSVFLLPFGAEIPVHAIYTAGGTVRVTPLPELSCESLAVADFGANDQQTPLACSVEGRVWLGTLSVAS